MSSTWSWSPSANYARAIATAVPEREDATGIGTTRLLTVYLLKKAASTALGWSGAWFNLRLPLWFRAQFPKLLGRIVLALHYHPGVMLNGHVVWGWGAVRGHVGASLVLSLGRTAIKLLFVVMSAACGWVWDLACLVQLALRSPSQGAYAPVNTLQLFMAFSLKTCKRLPGTSQPSTWAGSLHAPHFRHEEIVAQSC